MVYLHSLVKKLKKRLFFVDKKALVLYLIRVNLEKRHLFLNVFLWRAASSVGRATAF